VTLRGRFVAFEGVDGCGKTTQAQIFAMAVGALLTHEPGATDLGRRLRSLLLEPSAVPVTERAEALLMLADRAQHVVQVIEPALDLGRWVVSDRFSGSTLAYQGYGRGLPLDTLKELNTWAAGGLEPDLSALIAVPYPVARRRLAGRPADRLEQLDEQFYQRVSAGYEDLAAGDSHRWVVVDGTGTIDEVADRVRQAVVSRLGPLLGDWR
jgi:dTMP kinase